MNTFKETLKKKIRNTNEYLGDSENSTMYFSLVGGLAVLFAWLLGYI